jgi:hypothetical protein
MLFLLSPHRYPIIPIDAVIVSIVHGGGVDGAHDVGSGGDGSDAVVEVFDGWRYGGEGGNAVVFKRNIAFKNMVL